MTSLQLGWTILFVAAVALFFAVGIVVAVGGARDLREMFKALRGQRTSGDPE